jgi:hypothetical protein
VSLLPSCLVFLFALVSAKYLVSSCRPYGPTASRW